MFGSFKRDKLTVALNAVVKEQIHPFVQVIYVPSDGPKKKGYYLTLEGLKKQGDLPFFMAPVDPASATMLEDLKKQVFANGVFRYKNVADFFMILGEEWTKFINSKIGASCSFRVSRNYPSTDLHFNMTVCTPATLYCGFLLFQPGDFNWDGSIDVKYGIGGKNEWNINRLKCPKTDPAGYRELIASYFAGIGPQLVAKRAQMHGHSIALKNLDTDTISQFLLENHRILDRVERLLKREATKAAKAAKLAKTTAVS